MKTLQQRYIDQTIELRHDKVFTLVIENPSFLRKTLHALQSQLNNMEDFFFYADEKGKLDLSKDGFLVLNPADFRIDEKKVESVVQKDVASHVGPEQREEYEVLIQKVNDYIESLSYAYPFGLTFNSEMGLNALLKSVSLRPVEEPEGFLETILYKIRIVSYAFHYQVFFFLNLHDYLNDFEMSQFLNEIRSLELFVVFISSHKPRYKTNDESLILIDCDLCELDIE